MTHYFKIIKNENCYQFVMIPNNTHQQPMGYSPAYSSLKECHDACMHFKRLVQSHSVISSVEKDLENPNCIYYRFFDSDNNLLFQNRYNAKQNAKKSMHSIIKHIDAKIL